MKDTDEEICCICNKLIDEDNEGLGGDSCSICYNTICSNCYDKEPPKNYIHYGWLCPKC
jgi:hypothetical protein